MSKYNIAELDRDKWLHDTFPEWGTWLNEEIDAEVVPEGKLVMWWLSCTGIWFKRQVALTSRLTSGRDAVVLLKNNLRMRKLKIFRLSG